MKLNFWQWVGLAVFAVALIVIISREMRGTDKPAPNVPATQPAT
jgi:hypothetical protein